MTITFIHNKKAFLPEIGAYTGLFESLGIDCKIALPEDIDRIETDVEWHFMGTDTRRSAAKRIKIHEYTSGSVAPFRRLKDFSKKMANVKPGFRLFLNEYVKKQFGFQDNIPFGYRDMGVSPEWLNRTPASPAACKYDFVYTGDLSPSRHPEKLLEVFAKGTMKDKTILLISNNYVHMQNLYCNFSNIIFKGPVEHAAIRFMLPEARYAINYIIDKEPFNHQTSTKFLEYAACGLPVISTQYAWIEAFTSQYGGQCYYLKDDLSNFTWENINSFPFSSPDLSAWTWEKQIKTSGVLKFLQARFA